MDVAIEPDLQAFIDHVVRSGRYGSASEVVVEGLRLMQEREAKLQALRDTINASIAAGGENTPDEMAAFLDQVEADLAREGY